MKILIVSRGIPSQKDPQTGCFEMDQAKALKDLGHDVGILSIKLRPSLSAGKKFGMTSETINGISCFEFSGLSFRVFKRFLPSFLSGAIEKFFAPRILKKVMSVFGKPDIIHGHYLYNISTALHLASSSGIPVVGTEHWSRITADNPDKKVISYCRETYPHTAAMIAVSETLAKRMKDFSGVESRIIHNLIDTSSLLPAIAETHNQSFTIIALGSLIHRKGFDILIQAFAKSSLKNKNTVLKILGEGDRHQSLQNMIDELGLQDKVILTGQKNKSQVFEELHNADLFVLSSRLENFSVAVIEATANGVPAIATLCGGVEEYPVKEVTKIPVNDVEALANALDENYIKKDTLSRKSIQQQTLDHFAPGVIARQIEEVYKQVVEK